ncbi:MAG: hybrid sensor histidine kinase/response regulator [Deltaproteobacteria bacterium]|nr:hybrid sensor histidine kinase/response regulator [Deltaproteobacteria bacterium]
MLPSAALANMNLALVMSLVTGALSLSAGAILLVLARVPGWSSARVFVVIALSAGLYSFGNSLFCVPGLPDAVILAGARANYFLASVHSVGWLVFSFGGREASLAALPRPLRFLAWGMLALAAALLLTGLHLRDGLEVVETGIADVRYTYAITTPVGDAYGALIGFVLCLPFVRLIVRVKRGETELVWQALGFGVFLGCAGVEALVASRVIRFVSPADLGFLAIVLPMSADHLRRFAAQAARVQQLSEALADQVQERTEQRDRAESALVEAERLAALGRLAAGVGHEVNNPLTYLQLSLEEIHERLAAADPPTQVQEPLDNARDAAERIRKVVERLHAYSKRRDLRGSVDVKDAVKSALRVAGPRLRQLARVELCVEACPAVWGDESRLVQAVVNLLVNAAQAVEGAERPALVEVRCAPDAAGNVVVAVHDNGVGISPEDLRRVTEPYFTTRAESGGLGLGLFVTRGIADAHGGRLELESERGIGTRVRLVLPPAPIDHAPPAVPTAADAASPVGGLGAAATPSAPRPHVLLIEDEPALARTLARALARRFDVTTTASARDALARLGSGGFAAVICDLMLPGMSGMAFADRLAEVDPSLRARTIFITGGAVTTAATEFLDRADVDWMEKPLKLAELDARLSALAALSKA